MISVVLVSLNEAVKLERCFKSLDNFADEIIVLDLGSRDSTIDICKKNRVKIFNHAFVPFVEEVRNVAVAKASGDWILVLDPDEAISGELKNKLKQVVLQNQYVAVNIPRKNIFFGKWIAHTNWWPDKHVRFFKKGQVKWEDVIHKYPLVTGSVLDLEPKEEYAILHFSYSSVNEFMDRQNRYSSIQAKNLYDEGVRFSWGSVFWKPFREFLVRFIRHAGFMDGFHGFALTVLMMVYQLEVVIKLWELEKKK